MFVLINIFMEYIYIYMLIYDICLVMIYSIKNFLVFNVCCCGNPQTFYVSISIHGFYTMIICSCTVHEVTVEVTGPAVDNDNFFVRTIRFTPTSPGLLTSTATQDSFYSSMTSELILKPIERLQMSVLQFLSVISCALCG